MVPKKQKGMFQMYKLGDIKNPNKKKTIKPASLFAQLSKGKESNTIKCQSIIKAVLDNLSFFKLQANALHLSINIFYKQKY